MTRIFLSSGAFLLLAMAAAGPSRAAPATHCKSGESVVFSCNNGARIASLCALAGISSTGGSMQYRAGPPGNVDFAYPRRPGLASHDYRGASLMFSGGGGAVMRFVNRGYEYSVFSAVGKWGPNGEPRDKAGVVVRRHGKPYANFICRAPREVGEIGPDFFDKVGIKNSSDLNFEIPDAFFK